MEFEKIKQLIETMGNSKLSSIDIEFPDGIKIKMEKNNEKVVFSNENVKENVVPEIVDTPKEENIKTIKSPMVGTFYLKPSPTSEAYVEVGKQIKKGDIVCIVEAMKLMNEIESEYDGKILEILIKDGETVEYGKPLFKIG